MIIWNNFDQPETEQWNLFGEIFDTYCPRINPPPRTDLNAFFGSTPEKRVFDNPQVNDFDTLKGSLLSCSYAPLPDHPDYAALNDAIRDWFDTYQQDGLIHSQCHTNLFFGSLDS